MYCKQQLLCNNQSNYNTSSQLTSLLLRGEEEEGESSIMDKIVRDGGCSVVVVQQSEQWQLKPGALGSNPVGLLVFRLII